MSDPESMIIELSVDNAEEQERLLALFGEALSAPPSGTIRILGVKDESEPGAVETFFLIGLAIGLLSPTSAFGIWLLAHRGKNGGPIAASSTEGQALIAEITQKAPAAAPKA